jgi:4-alpha-glucanotransferase
LHVTSLPSPYGIGDLGSSAFSWVDRLHDAGLAWWQALPLGPTGYGNSPYQSLSSFAGNALLISPASLISDGLLRRPLILTFPQTRSTTIRHSIQAAAARKGMGNFKAGERKDLQTCL